MVIGALFHVAIRTSDLEGTIAFYTHLLGMHLAKRPPFGFPGAWIKPSLTDLAPTIHVYAGDAAKDENGHFAQGTGVIDHVSMVAYGYQSYLERFIATGLPYRENRVPETSLAQLFVYDPNGVMLELIFDVATEPDTLEQAVPVETQYKPKERWFDETSYRNLSDRFSPVR
ncbi:VOC family protein [Parasalinivibrio latis]|uniref:VOC family protein n=1 Tax=Parasalinivibrio latis TaxID=2952610 RepID=UPI0030E365F3